MKTSKGGRGSARVLGRGKVLSGGQVPRASKIFCPLEAGKKMVNKPLNLEKEAWLELCVWK